MSPASRSRTAVVGRGLAALLGMLLILVGLPIALVVLGGNPLPAQMPTIEEITAALTRPDDGTLLIGIVTVVGWLVWASLVLSFLVEIPAAIRGVPAPRLPGLSWQQGRAAAMTGAVAAMLAIGTPAMAHASPGNVTQTSASAPAADTHHDTVTSVTVRSGDTLWDVAQRELGDGHRYPELVEASATVEQPDGGRLRGAHDIRPGWKVAIPQAVAAGNSDGELTDTTALPNLEEQMSGAGSARATADVDAPLERPVADHRGGIEGSLDPAPATSSAHAPTAATGLGAIVCVGALALVRSRRRRQQRTRPPGWRLAAPSVGAARAQAWLEVSGDDTGPHDLYSALADLAARCAPGALPSLRAARLSPDAIEAYVVEEDMVAPSPWASAGGGTWVLDRANVQPDEASGSSPWPCLVTLGQDEDGGHVFINLEEIGALEFRGRASDVEGVLAAIAIDLATSAWERPHVNVVGSCADLIDAVDDPSVTYTPDIGQVLDRLEGTAADAARPEILLVGTELGTQDVRRLQGLRTRAPGGALAVVSTSAGLSDWSLSVDAGNGKLAAILDPTGMSVRPPLLTHPEYTDLLELLRSTSEDPVPGPQWTQGSGDDPLTLQTVPRQRITGVATGPAGEETTNLAQFTASRRSRIRVLGPVEVTGVGPRPSDEQLAAELATLLALHPGSDPEGVAGLLGLPVEDLQAALREAVPWLEPSTAADPTGGASHLRLSDVLVDWQQLRTLVGPALANADSRGVRAALTLVTGRPFDDTPQGRYSWAIADRREICAAVADIAHELAQRCLHAGDPAGASWAAGKGLLAEPLNEALWRDEVHAAWQAGQPQHAKDLLGDAESALGDLGGLTGDAIAMGERRGSNDPLAAKRTAQSARGPRTR